MLRFTKKWAFLLVFAVFFSFFASSAPANADWIQGLGLARSNSALPSNNLVERVVLNVMLWLLRLFTLIAVIGFVIYGLMFILAGANSNLTEKAKKGVGFAITGIAVGIAGYIIISQINALLIAG